MSCRVVADTVDIGGNAMAEPSVEIALTGRERRRLEGWAWSARFVMMSLSRS
jgi:hypothetical protein